MSPEAFAYPFLFIAIFFEAFMLVTFLSEPARNARKRKAPTKLPRVALIVPCYNEEKSIEHTVTQALALDYPANKLELILVNDGSTDDTLKRMQLFAHYPQVHIIDKENGGKHTALNAGIAATTAEIIGCLDADTYPEPDALKQTLACFDRPNVAAAMAAIAIHKPKGLLQHAQSAEYLMQIFYRHALCSINAMYVTPGPFSLYRRSVFEKVGGFVFGQQTEDMEMALRLHRHGYEIENAPGARVTTQSMPTVRALVKQRTRWITGYFRNLYFDYNDLLSKKYGVLGLLVLPLGVIGPFSVIVLFLLNVYFLGHGLVEMYLVHSGVPLSWQLSSLAATNWADWFYIPMTTYALFAIVTLVLGIVMMAIGKRTSQANAPMGSGVLGYVLIYTFIAPFWFMRATGDFLTGARRGWR